jgi:hypothetical protein
MIRLHDFQGDFSLSDNLLVIYSLQWTFIDPDKAFTFIMDWNKQFVIVTMYRYRVSLSSVG